MTALSTIEAYALRRARRFLIRRIRPRPELGLEKIGTAYGGWIVPTQRMDATWRCYSGGVGEDVSFDLGIISRFGCAVFAFDPTPRAIRHVEPIVATEPRFRFFPVGLWSSDTTLRFYAPQDPLHVSHSVVNLQRTSTWFEAPCRTVRSLMDELGHESIDLLKVDIEGAEHAVIPSALRARIRPRVLCFEVDQPVATLRFLRLIRFVHNAGYDLVAVDGWNFTFVRQDALPDAAVSGKDGA